MPRDSLACDKSFSVIAPLIFEKSQYFRFHGCPEIDCPTRAKDPRSAEKFAKFEEQLKTLQEVHGYLSNNIIVVQECQWNSQRKSNEIQDYLRQFPVRPNCRLDPQLAVKSALNECYKFKYPCKVGGDKNLYAVDMSSLYPHVAITTSFPVGKYQTLVGLDIKQEEVKFELDSFKYQGKEYMGLIHLRILPPQNLERPFLLTKIGQQTVAVLCRSCALALNQDGCNHTPAERHIDDIWTTQELCFAIVALGYKPVAFFEFMLYSESGPVLQKFTSLLGFHKLKFSNFPPNVNAQNPKELQDYCSSLNTDMCFQDNIGKQLLLSDICPNSSMRSYYKSSLVKWLGVFSTNLSKRVVTKFLTDVRSLHYYANKKMIKDLSIINERYVQVSLEGARDLGQNDNRVCRKANAPIGAIITSVARVVMYKHMLELAKIGGHTLKIATDALYFTLSRENPFVYSEAFGRFKPIYPGTLKTLTQLGINNYCVTFTSPDGNTICEVKVSGLRLSHFLTSSLNFDLYTLMAERLFNDKLFNFKSFSCYNKRRKIDSKTLSNSFVMRKQSIFSRNVLARRVVIPEDYESKPYGYVVL